MGRAASIALRLAALSCLVVSLSMLAAGARAQVQSEAVNRENVPAGEATPTGASFSVDFPVPFSDLVITPEEGTGPIRMVTGVTDDHITFTASQFDIKPGRKLQPLEDFMNHVRDKAGADPSGVAQDNNGGVETLSFAVIGLNGAGSLYKVIRTSSAQYVLTIQFQAAHRDDATSLSFPFFGSFKLIKK